MSDHRHSPWHVEYVDHEAVDRIASTHVAHAEAVSMGVDIVGDPHREDDEGRNWTRLRFARSVPDVVPGSAIVMGTPVGKYLAKVVAWDFEVSDEDPIVVLELVPLTPESVQAAIRRSSISAA
jgi:hypothetical protein